MDLKVKCTQAQIKGLNDIMDSGDDQMITVILEGVTIRDLLQQIHSYIGPSSLRAYTEDIVKENAK